MMEPKNILISGCSGGGKSTLLEALSRLGHATVPEPGRRIVAEELRGDGKALPWVNLHAFAERAIQMAEADLAAAESLEGFVFFDRGLVDAAVAFEFAGGTAYRLLLAGKRHYAQRRDVKRARDALRSSPIFPTVQGARASISEAIRPTSGMSIGSASTLAPAGRCSSIRTEA